MNLSLIEHLIDVKQRALHKGEELVRITESIESFHQSLDKFMEYLTECERYLNHQKPVERHCRFYQRLLKQIDEHQAFEKQCEIYQEHWTNLNQSILHLNGILSKKEALHLRNSFVSIRKRWENILMRTHQRRKDLERVKQVIETIVFNIISLLYY